MRLTPSLKTIGACIVTLFGVAQLSAAADSPDFQRDIQPLLYHRCFSCHSEKKDQPKGELRLDSAQGIHDSGVVVAGNPDESELLVRVSLPHSDTDLMPPLKGGGQPLSDSERALLRRWIADGAKTGDWVKFDHRQPAMTVRDAPLSRADVPHLARRVDELVQQSNADKGKTMNAAINDNVFLRRVYLDVAGRIPSLSESRRFLDSTAADKRAKLIDELLNREGYVSHTFNWKADQLRLVTNRVIAGQPAWMYDEWVKESIRSKIPYDEYVRRLVTASGYLWENGAMGFYLRDQGMPLDHMSNLARVFLGTRVECAQCHDHPFEPITQKDFYQLAAFTSGVSTYGTENVEHWRELQSQLNAMNAPRNLYDSVSGTVAILKRRTKDTSYQLKFPDSYVNDPAARGTVVDARTPFGDDPAVTVENRRAVFADWLTSSRNPRFALNIANRLWKRVIGLGLIEPVDSLSAINHTEHAALTDFLTQTIVRLGFDERAFLAVLLNTRLYQSESVREEPEPGASFHLRGPLLRRLSAEQAWDSLLVLLVEGLDDRRPMKADRGALGREQVTQLSKMNAVELMERAKLMLQYRTEQRQQSFQSADRKEAIKQAKESGDSAEVRRLENEQIESDTKINLLRDALQMSRHPAPKETDPRWVSLPSALVRASEIETPIELGHFLRQFGQSDRREIDAYNRNPNITHSLALMNGDLTRMILDERSFLRTQLRQFATGEQRLNAIYQAILVRSATVEEAKHCLPIFGTSPSPEADMIWALLNTPEFLFIQ
jgi:hypothetical protein